MKRILTGIFFFLFLFCFSTKTFAQASGFSPEEILVRFSPTTSMAQIDKFNKEFGAFNKEKLLLPSTFVLKVPFGKEKDFARIFSSLPGVIFAEPNVEYKALMTPNDPNYSQQWGLSKIGAPNAWDVTLGNSGVKIAIVDTGIDKNHLDLSSKVDSWVNYSSASSNDDLNGHGTHVAGIAAAITNNSIGVAGLGFNSHLLSVKVLNDRGSGYTSSIANGITWATNNGAKVINLSLGGSSASKTMEDAINYAWSKGVVVSCAAGNDGRSTPMYPAYYQNCIAVAATDQSDQKTSWSNYGSWVDVASPGLDILSTLPNHKARMTSVRNYGYASGTSMATPFVSGLAGLIFGENSSLSNSQVREIIESNAQAISGTGSYWAKGRIDAAGAVLAASGSQTVPSSTPTPTPTLEIVPTATPTPTSTPVSTSTPTPTSTPTATPTPKPVLTTTPTPTPLPWWCRYRPSLCQ